MAPLPPRSNNDHTAFLEVSVGFQTRNRLSPLPRNTIVRELRYERLTDWHLDALLDLGAAAAVETYVRQARQARKQNVEYCGDNETPQSVGYFLAKWVACGNIQRGPTPNTLRIECNTR